eukprot:s1651_g12.t1
MDVLPLEKSPKSVKAILEICHASPGEIIKPIARDLRCIRPFPPGSMAVNLAQFESVLARLESVADRLEKGTSGGGAAGSGSAGAGEDVPPIVMAFDMFLQGKILPVEGCAKDLNSKDVTEATEIYVAGLRLLRELFVATGSCQKPQDADWGKILGPVMELGQKAQKACDSRSEFFQHRKASAESLNVIMLVTSPSPPGHVQSILETFDFHANKVLQKKVEKETAWVKAFKESLKELKDWCAENCKMGVIWNVKGQAALDYFTAHPLGSAPSGAAAPKAGKGKGKGPPPPKGGFVGMPEEVKAKLKAETAPKAAPAAGGMSAVFNAIGGFDTGKLKKGFEVAMSQEGSWRGLQPSWVTLDKDGYAALNRKDQEAQKPVEPVGAAIFRKLIFDSPLNVLLLTVPFGIAAPRLDWSDQADG